MKRLVLATAVSAQALLGHAQAQEADDARRLEAVVITSAPGPDRASDELVGNATALDRQDIIGRLSGTLGDTLASEPGVSSTFFGQGASRPVLRGLGAERVQVLTNGIGVIDVSAASPDHQVTADGIDADKIEILRGPAALAYGGQAIGGVVNVIDGLIRDELPDETFSGEAYAAYNGVNDGTEGGVRASLVTGPIVLSLTASRRDFGDYRIPGLAESRQLRHQEEQEEDAGHEHEEAGEGLVPNSFLNTETYGAGVSWIGEKAFAGLAVRRQTATYGLAGHAHEHDEEAEAAEPEEEPAPFIDLEQTRYDFRGGLTFDGDVFKALTATLSYSDYEHGEIEDGAASSLFQSDGYEGRVELDHSFAGMEGALGVQFLDKSLVALGEEAFLTPTDTRSWAAFMYEARDWDSGFGIEGGVRYETLEHDNQVARTASFDLVSASAGLHQHFGDHWFAGVQAAYTERAPNESELFAFGPHLATRQFEVGDATLDKERGLNLEGTLRWQSDRLKLGVNVFRTSFSDFIYLAPGAFDDEGTPVEEEDGLPVFVFSQDDATFTGGELYGEYLIDSNLLGADWTLKSGLDYVRAELDSGGDVPLVPPLSVTAGLDAHWDKVSAGASVEWADNQSHVGVGEPGTSSYTILNLKTALQLSEYGIGREGTQLFVELRNATNEEARLSTSTLRDLVPLPGRNFRAGLRYTF